MKNENYTNEIIEAVKQLIPGVEIREVKKTQINGEVLTGISAVMPGSIIGPSIWPEKLEAQGITPEKAAQILKEGFDKTPDINNVEDYVPEQIIPKLVNRAANKEIEKNCVCRVVMGDLLLYYCRELQDDEEGSMRFNIPKNLFEGWGITEEEMYEQAMKNLKKKAQVASLRDVLKSAMGEDVPDFLLPPMDPPMMCVSTQRKSYGAAAILLPEVQDKLSEVFGGDYIVIPSSIHEVLAVPADMMDAEVAAGMINAVNTDEVAPNEVLSDHGYIKRWNSSEIEPYTTEEETA